MKQNAFSLYAFILFLVSAFFFTGCSDTGASSEPSEHLRTTNTVFLKPEHTGEICYEADGICLDASASGEGYMMIEYTGEAAQTRLQVTLPDSTIYTYALRTGAYETIPFTGGDGTYHIAILENVYDDMYALAFSQDIAVTLSDEFKPYLYPNQYVWFTSDSQTTAFGMELSGQSTSDLDYLEKVYAYVTENIVYDTELAANVPLNYIPDIDKTLTEKKGICFDYAALMTALLRSQNIPTKLVVGYSGTAYHSWISVYLQETGWVDNIIRFDGHSWSLMDPTLAAGNSSSEVEKYIGDGSNYLAKYYY